MKIQPRYFLLTGEWIFSRKAKNQDTGQKRLKEVFQLVHSQFEQAILSRFNFISGREFQGLLGGESPRVLRIVRTFQEEMAPHQTVFGIGFGTLSTPILPDGTFMMDGEVFQRSRKALMWIQSGKARCPVVFRLGSDLMGAERLLNLFLSTLRWKPWTARQKEVTKLYRSLGTQVKVAKELHITRQAVSDILHSARYYLFESAIQAVDPFLSTLVGG